MKKMIIELFLALPLIVGGASCNSEEVPAMPIENKQYKVLPHTTSMEVRWKDATGVVRFCAEYAADASMSAVQSVEVETPSTNILIEGLSPETDYYVRTRAYNGSRWTEWTDVTPIRTARFTVTAESYNLLGADITTKGPSWEERKSHVGDIIRQSNNDPDILCVQECAIASQKADMKAMLGDLYDYSENEKATSSPGLIFWKKEVFEQEERAIFDLLNGKYPNTYEKQRYGHFVKLKHLASGNSILVYSVHLRAGADAATAVLRKEMIDNLCPLAAQKSAETGCPVIVLGDMNCTPNRIIGGIPSSPQIYKSHGFLDTFTQTRQRTNENYATYSSSAAVVEDCKIEVGEDGSRRIDYIFTYPESGVTTTRYATVLNFAGDGTVNKLQSPLPSDHHPVRAELNFFYE